MAEAAEERAGAEVVAGLRSLEPAPVRVAGHGLDLPAQLRDPPGVDDVLGDDLEHDRRVRRHDHLVGAVGVVELVGEVP